MAKRTPQRPEYEDKQFTVESIDKGITLLQRRIEDVKALHGVSHKDARVESVESSIQHTVREIFGDRSHEFEEHRNFTISQANKIVRDPSYYQREFESGISGAVTKLQGLIRHLEETREFLPAPPSSNAAPTPMSAPVGRKVFVVHGRDEAAKETVARFLEKLKLEAIILHEQANRGQTVIEKLETNSDVRFAVVLLTPDDIGGLAGTEPDKLKPRARQNVVLEFGYFIGKLGRNHVCALYKAGVELPSDVDGLLYVSMDDRGWRMDLAREIDAAGIEVDLNLAK